MGSSIKDTACALLKDTSWFKDASEELIDALASVMVPIEAKDGHIFIEEGQIMRFFLIIEQGTLARTRYSASEEADIQELSLSFRTMKQAEVTEKLAQVSVLIDTMGGRGRVTGMMHCLESKSKAYATVTARGDAKVWIISAEDFRDALSKSTAFCWEFMVAMSREIRSGSKSIAKLLAALRDGQQDDNDSNKNILRVLCYDATSWVTENFKPAIEAFNQTNSEDENGLTIQMDFTTERLGAHSATYAAGYEAVCLFVNDTADADVMQTLSRLGVKMIAQRAAGFDRIDTKAARAFGMTVARVPAYSPYAVAEMAVTLLMTVNRKITRASNRVKLANFSLDGGLMGMDIHGKTVGVMGTGKIGQVLCRILTGFGANLICYDVFESNEVKEMGGKYVSQDEIFATSDVLFLMMPLLPATKHTINDESITKLKKGVILINTSRGGLVDTKALLKGIKSGIISGVGMDVYENEGDYFFQDWSARQIKDSDLAELLGHSNVVLTAHQAFFTKEAVDKIVSTTIENLDEYKKGKTGLLHPNNCIPAQNPSS